MQWQGPFEVLGRVAQHNYKLQVRGKEKTYHANLLKKYVERDGVESTFTEANSVSVVSEQVSDDESVSIECPSVTQTEGIDDVHISDEIDAKEREELVGLVSDFTDVLTDVPGHTDIAQHIIQLKTNDPIRSRPYHVPHT